MNMEKLIIRNNKSNTTANERSYISLLIDVAAIDDVLVASERIVGGYEESELSRGLIEIVEHARVHEYLHELTELRRAAYRIRAHVEQCRDVVWHGRREHSIDHVHGAVGDTRVRVYDRRLHGRILRRLK